MTLPVPVDHLAIGGFGAAAGAIFREPTGLRGEIADFYSGGVGRACVVRFLCPCRDSDQQDRGDDFEHIRGHIQFLPPGIFMISKQMGFPVFAHRIFADLDRGLSFLLRIIREDGIGADLAVNAGPQPIAEGRSLRDGLRRCES